MMIIFDWNGVAGDILTICSKTARVLIYILWRDGRVGLNFVSSEHKLCTSSQMNTVCPQDAILAHERWESKETFATESKQMQKVWI